MKIDYQWFPFGELGKKLSVGYATGTAPEGFVCYDWFMPTFLDKGLLAPMDVQRLGYASIDAYRDDHSTPAAMSSMHDGKVYGFPSWFYGFVNYINTKHFKEVGLDPDKDAPQTWTQFGETAKRLTKRDGARFSRQGAKFAMHAAQWTMIQFNPILIQCGGKWFDDAGKCTVNSDAGVKAMTIRASLVRDYGAEDPADWSPPIRCRRTTSSRRSRQCSQPPCSARRIPVAEPADGGREVFPPGAVSGRGSGERQRHRLRLQPRCQRADHAKTSRRFCTTSTRS